MKFVCLGYLDETAWDAIPAEEKRTLMENCFAYDNELKRGGHWLGGEGLHAIANTVTLRMRNGSVAATDGPFIETKEQLGGILMLQARDMTHAVALMSKHPGVKIGPFEIRPAYEDAQAIMESETQSS